jgi:hypothetical protein
MQSSNWAPEHSQALREYLAKGMSHSEIADAINSRFGTAYTRSATIGRGKRMGLAGPDRPEGEPKRPPKAKTPRLKAPRSKAPRSKARRLKAPSLQKSRKRRPGRIESVAAGARTRRSRQASLRRHHAASAFTGRARGERLPLPLWRRQGGRGHCVLRPSAARRLELLRAAFSFDARDRNAIGASGRSGPAAAGRGRLSAAQYRDFQRR